MRRRTYLRTAGLVAGLGLAGCLGGDAPGPAGDGGGSPEATGDGGAAEAANEFGYPTTTTEGVAVPLVPLADAIEWYRDDVGVFADARSGRAFEAARIAGAVHSPAPDGRDTADPVAERPEDTRVVTYCGCPHHLSTLRGATLIRNGYAHTYAIDEGFQAWREAGYPLEGEDVDESPALFTVAGRTAPDYAGEFAWLWHDPSGQREAAPIDDRGRFELHVRFHEVGPDTPVRLSTPAGEVEGPLGALAGDPVRV